MPRTNRAEVREFALADLLAVFAGADAAHIAAVEFALTESARGHFHCAREALRRVPADHLRQAITGAAVLSRLATDLLVDTAKAPADDLAGPRP